MPAKESENEALNWKRRTEMKRGVRKRCESYFT